MDWLVALGAILTFSGFALLVRCILKALAIKRAALPEAETRTALERIVPLNLAALCASALGLMMVVVGIALG